MPKKKELNKLLVMEEKVPCSPCTLSSPHCWWAMGVSFPCHLQPASMHFLHIDEKTRQHGCKILAVWLKDRDY